MNINMTHDMNTKMTYNQKKTRRGFHGGRMMRYALMIMMMMVVRATGAWGQTVY